MQNENNVSTQACVVPQSYLREYRYSINTGDGLTWKTVEAVQQQQRQQQFIVNDSNSNSNKNNNQNSCTKLGVASMSTFVVVSLSILSAGCCCLPYASVAPDASNHPPRRALTMLQHRSSHVSVTRLYPTTYVGNEQTPNEQMETIPRQWKSTPCTLGGGVTFRE